MLADLSDNHSFPTRRSSGLVHKAAKNGAADGVLGSQALYTGNCRADRGASFAPVLPQRREESPVSLLQFGEALACASGDRKSTRLNSSHGYTSHAVFCLKKK